MVEVLPAPTCKSPSEAIHDPRVIEDAAETAPPEMEGGRCGSPAEPATAEPRAESASLSKAKMKKQLERRAPSDRVRRRPDYLGCEP